MLSETASSSRSGDGDRTFCERSNDFCQATKSVKKRPVNRPCGDSATLGTCRGHWSAREKSSGQRSSLPFTERFSNNFWKKGVAAKFSASGTAGGTSFSAAARSTELDVSGAAPLGSACERKRVAK